MRLILHKNDISTHIYHTDTQLIITFCEYVLFTMVQNWEATDAGTCGAMNHLDSDAFAPVNVSCISCFTHTSAFSGRVISEHGVSHTAGASDHWPTLHCE